MKEWVVLVAFLVFVSMASGIVWYTHQERTPRFSSIAPDPNYDGPCCIALVGMSP
jgi:hypothetical protein